MPEPEDSQSFDLSQIPQFLRRRRWWILLTACVVTLASIVVVQVLPNKYTSEATVLVIQQQVPERYVVSTTTTDVSEALQGMTQQVVSRSSLLGIIDSVGLYASEREHVAPEILIARMRKRLDIQPLESGPARKNVNSFKITFVADNAHTAHDVTSRVTDLFIQENVRMREHQATVTTDFLQEQLETVRKRLMDQEAVVRSYKMQHLGELPEQEQGNSQILASLSSQLQNTGAALSRAQEQKAYLESLLRGYEDLAARDASAAGVPSGGGLSNDLPVSPTAALESELAHLQSEKATLLSKYTADHPDVEKKSAEIARVEASLAHAKSLPQAPPPKKGEKPVVVTSRRQEAPIAQVNSQLEANRVEMEHLTKDANQLKEKIAQYQERINATPMREQQLAGMLRDYQLLQQNYADLLKKQQESGLAMSLEKHQEGQQFRVVDPASLPALPSFPNRPLFRLGGAGAGIALGVALAFLLEMIEPRFYSEKQLRNRIKMPLVIALPELLTAREDHRRTTRRVFEWLAGTALILTVLVAEFYVYKRG